MGGAVSRVLPLMALVALAVICAGQIRQVWRLDYDYATHADRAFAITTDAAGHIYVVGESEVAGRGRSDYLALKISPAGQLIWQARARFNNYYFQAHHASVYEPDGSVAVTGDAGTVMFSQAGELIWTQAGYRGLRTVFDPAGNVYAVGYRHPSNFSIGVVRKYNHDGYQLWALDIGFDGLIGSIVLDGEGNAYVAGAGNGSTIVAKLSPLGGVVWQRSYPGGAGGALSFAPNGDLFVIFNTLSDPYGSISSGGLMRLEPSTGSVIWRRSYSAFVPNTFQWAEVSPDGSFYVLASTGWSGYRDIAALKYSSSGKLLWEKHLGGSANVEDFGTDLKLGPDGSVYVVALWNLYVARECVLFKFSPQGRLLEQYSTGLIGIGSYPYPKIAVTAGTVFLAATPWAGYGTGHDITVLRLRSE
jgi:hypothetical protein